MWIIVIFPHNFCHPHEFEAFGHDINLNIFAHLQIYVAGNIATSNNCFFYLFHPLLQDLKNVLTFIAECMYKEACVTVEIGSILYYTRYITDDI